MKRIFLLWLLLFSFSWSTAHAEEQVNLPLLFEPIQLYGPMSEHLMYYTIDGQSSHAELQLVLTHSTALIEPSAVTVEIDDELVATKLLEKDSSGKIEWTIPLQKNMKQEGTHVVRVKFDGVILQGVCVDQQTTSNWMMVHLQSHVTLYNYERTYTTSLSRWTEDYVPTNDQKTAIIIPKKADEQIKSAALRLRSYLANLSERPQQIIITDDATIEGHKIVLGSYNQFEKTVQQRLAQVERIDGEMQLGRLDEQFSYAMADDSTQLEQLLPILYEERWRKQLSQERLSLAQLPEKPIKQSTFTFAELGIAPITLDSVTVDSAKYALSLPYALPRNGETTVHIQFQKSTLLELNEQFEINEQAELIVSINSMLYPATLKKQTGILEVKIPNEQLMRSSKFTFQLKSNGLRVNDPCISTDRQLWIQVDPGHSTFEFTNAQVVNESPSFDQYPHPFVYEETVVVLPSWDVMSSEAFDTLIQSFDLNQTMTYFRTINEIEEPLKKSAHFIFIQPHLYMEDLDFTIKNNKWNSPQFGFIEGVEDYVLTAKESLWNEEKQAFYIDTMRESIVSFEWLEPFIQNQINSKHAIVNTAGRILYESSDESAIESTVQEQSTEWSLFLAGFGLMVIALIFGIIMLVKRRKNRG